jgi:hypothetical protein
LELLTEVEGNRGGATLGERGEGMDVSEHFRSDLETICAGYRNSNCRARSSEKSLMEPKKNLKRILVLKKNI